MADRPKRRPLWPSEPPPPRDRHAIPPKHPWLVRIIIVIAVVVVVAGIVISAATGVLFRSVNGG